MKDQCDPPLEQQLAQSALKALAQVPFARSEITGAPTDQTRSRGDRPDAAIAVEVGGAIYLLVIRTEGKGEPLVARHAVAQLLHYVGPLARTVGVFAAPYISPEAAAICQEAGIGYLDLAGNCHLAFASVYIHIGGKRNHAPERRPLRSLYAPKAERVLRVLLQEPGRTWQIQPLATAARVSVGLVSKVKSLLRDREWIASTSAAGLRLTRPGALLDDWAPVYAARRLRHHEFFCLKDLPDIERGIAEACRGAGQRYALTGLSAAARTAPFVRYQRADAYVVGPLAPIIDALEMKTVPSGSNVRIRTPYDEGVLLSPGEDDGIVLVSPLQNYLDLCAEGGRAGDSAEFLRERFIEPAWGGTQ